MVCMYLVRLLWNVNWVYIGELVILFSRSFPVLTEDNSICCEEHEIVWDIPESNTPHILEECTTHQTKNGGSYY